MPDYVSQREPVMDGIPWFHAILTTYGSWLPGDPRGFRTRHHRDHVEGDYKNPPKSGAHSELLKASKAAMKRDPVTLTAEQRAIIGTAIRNKAPECDTVLACLAAAAKHVHLLIQIDERETRTTAGVFKRDAWFTMRDAGYGRKLWAKGAKFVPVETRPHWDNTFAYILRHESEGAFVWRWDVDVEELRMQG